VAALYFFWNPTEGPFIIIPSLAEEDKQSTFKMTSIQYKNYSYFLFYFNIKISF
jgi:hypothetical protein